MRKKLYIFLPLLLVVTSCKNFERNFNDANKYNASNWKDNYYNVYDPEFSNAALRNTFNLSSCDIFTSFYDQKFKEIDPDGSKMNLLSEDEELSYSMNRRLINYNSELKYGVISKLFDGKMFCNGRYEKVRTQINSTGFGFKTNKKIEKYDYFAMNFRCDLDFKSDGSVPESKSSFKLNISFLFDDKIDIYSYDMTDVITNGDHYIFYGFSLKNFDLKGCNGIGVSYSNFANTYNDSLEQKKDEALLIYEILLPNTTWY